MKNDVKRMLKRFQQLRRLKTLKPRRSTRGVAVCTACLSFESGICLEEFSFFRMVFGALIMSGPTRPYALLCENKMQMRDVVHEFRQRG